MVNQVSFVFSLCAVCVVAYSPENFIKLTLGVSKAAYLERYCVNGNITENHKSWEFNDDPKDDQPACSIGGWTCKRFDKEDTELIMLKNDKQKLVVFGFRGTETFTLEDWRKNFDTVLTNAHIGKDSFRIHRGFYKRYNTTSSWFEKQYSQVPNDYTILITGHSLGGAEATIAAVYAAGKLNRKPDAVVTYGSPKVGDSQFKQYYKRKVGCDRSIRMSVVFDPAPSFPPLNPEYEHVCTVVEVLGNCGFNLLCKHGLYDGYQDGIKKKYTNLHDINIKVGCDQPLV